MAYQIFTKPLLRTVLILLAIWALFAGLYYGRPFLVPLFFAGIFAMLLWPISRKLESWGLNDKLAALCSVLLFVSIIAGTFWLLSNQIKGFREELPQLKQAFEQKLEEAQAFIEDRFGIKEQRQEKAITQQGPGQAQTAGKQAAFYLVNVLTKFLLMLVYIFLFLIYRQKFKNFILKYTPEERKSKAHDVIVRSASVAKDYLAGRLLLILILGVCYCVGLSIIGIKQAIFFGILAAIFAIIPFIGNILGAFFPLAMALLNQGTTAALAVVGLFTVVQLLENYILEPMVVGKKVDLNAFFAISVVILGEILWGISGAILAMPLLGIAKIIFDNVKQLRPLGYLVGEDEEEDRHHHTRQ